MNPRLRMAPPPGSSAQLSKGLAIRQCVRSHIEVFKGLMMMRIIHARSKLKAFVVHGSSQPISSGQIDSLAGNCSELASSSISDHR